MTIESASYVSELNSTYPAAGDDRSEGDDHLRLIKAALVATFPGLAGRFNRFQSKGTNYLGLLTDANSVIHFTAGATLTLTAAATLGNGWSALVHAAGGAVVIDPDGTEQVNGATTMTVAQNDMALLYCSGTAFYAFVLHRAGSFPSGTRMFFQQTSAPTGWTKVTDAAYNDAAIRLTTGTAATGGADAFNTLFGTSKTTASHTLTSAQMPVHTHTVNDSGHTHDVATSSTGSGTGFPTGGGFLVNGTGRASSSDTTGITLANAGSGSGHTHNLSDMNLKFADSILATKD